MDFSVVDDVVQVTDREAFLTTRRLVREEGLFCGGSSGAAGVGALKYLRALPDTGAGVRVGVILPGFGSRYLLENFFHHLVRGDGMLGMGIGTGRGPVKA